MSSAVRMVALVLAGIAVVLIYSSAFVVPQTSQALVFRFGKISRPPITDPGLYWKVPFIETVAEIDRRILDLGGGFGRLLVGCLFGDVEFEIARRHRLKRFRRARAAALEQL